MKRKSKRKSIVLNGVQFNFSITPEHMAKAIAKVDGYSLEEKIRRFDDIFAEQPAVLGLAVQLSSALGVDLRLVDHAHHVLLVLFECFSSLVTKLPKIQPSAVQKAIDDIESMLNFYEGESIEEAQRLYSIGMKNHKEHAVIAFVTCYLDSHLKEPNRDQELVRKCCMAMTNAYLATYETTLSQSLSCGTQ
jgi:hypothetical protein